MKNPDSKDKLISALETYFSGLSPDRYRKLEEEIIHDGKINHATLIGIYVKRVKIFELSDAYQMVLREARKWF